MKAIFRGLSGRICISLFIFSVAAGRAFAQTNADQISADANPIPDQIDALQLQLTNAWHSVEAIVNQPVRTYRRDDSYRISIYSPGWFHPGASTPDFNNTDVRKSQELPYTSPWVSSDVSPTFMFRGSDLEFNSMTKLFYTNRDIPKKRLTEAEMVQINALYRTIGQCKREIDHLQFHPTPEDTRDTVGDADDTNAPPKAIAAIERIPQQTRILYGSIGIGVLLVLAIVFRLIRKRSD